MAFNITKDIIDDVSSKINYDVGFYLSGYHYFLNNHYSNIVDFYSGKIKEIKYINFRFLNNLIKESENFNSNLRDNKYKFTTYIDWEIIDYFTDLREKLITISKIQKFLRSSKTNVNFSNKFEFEHTLRQDENLEVAAVKMTQSGDHNNDWVDIAIRNDLSELDYDNSGGKRIIMSVDLNTEVLTVKSVIDNIQGEKVLGLDLQRKVEFVDNDLKVLSYQETFEQSVDILIKLRRGDSNEFLDFGTSNFIGSSVNSFGFSSMIRQISEIFSSDDSIIEFNVVDVEKRLDEGGDLFVRYSVKSRLDLVDKKGTINI